MVVLGAIVRRFHDTAGEIGVDTDQADSRGPTWRRRYARRGPAPARLARVILLASNIALIGSLWVASSGTVAEAQPSPWVDRRAPTYRPVASAVADDRQMAEAGAVFAVAQDATGFIWFGTFAGLERWDGYHLRRYVASPGDPCTLPDQRVSTLFVDEGQRLWMGTIGGDVARYEPETDCIHTVGGVSTELKGAVVEALTGDGDGGLWIGSQAGLVHLAADRQSVTRLSEAASDAGRLSHARISAVLRDHGGALWVGGDMGLARRSRSEARFAAIPLPPSARVRSLLEASDGRIWVGTVAHGAFVIDPSTLRVQAVADLLRRDPVPLMLRAAETSSGEIWFATPNTGIIVVDPVSLQTRVLHHQKGVSLTLADDLVSTVFRDRSGLVWVATNTGVGYFNTRADIATILTTDEANGLPEGQIQALVRMSDGRIALGVNNQIALIGSRGNAVEWVPLALRPAPQAISSLATLNGRDLFAGVQPHGLVWVDRAAGRAHVVPLPGPSVSPHVLSLLGDGDRLWAGGLEGLWLIVPRTDGGVSPLPWRVAEHFDLGEITAMAAGSGDVRWFGSEHGIYRMERDATTPKPLELLTAAGAPLQLGLVTALLSDRHGRLWVGTGSQGAFVIDPSTRSGDRVRVLRQFLPELPGAAIASILEDGRGGIWLATDHGFAHVDPEYFAVRQLVRGDGIAIASAASGVCTTPACSELMFGGQDGLTLIYPNQPTPQVEPAPVVITRISVGREEVPSARFNTNVADQVLSVPAQAHSLAVEFAALDYTDPARNIYESLLEGYDSGWVPTGFDTRMATYMNLPPGTYRLRLRGTDHSGVWSGKERQIVVQVAAAWYQTMWFHLLETVAVVLSVLLIVQVRTVILRQRQRELESLVAERTQALVRVTAARTTLIENISHDLRTPLTSLRAYLESLSLKDATLSEADRGQYVGIALRQVKRLGRLVRELFDLVRLDEPAARLTLERFSPSELIQDVVQEFGSIADGRTIEVHVDPGADSVQLMGDISLIQRMIDNLVDNAVQHTPPGGKITATLSTDDSNVVLEVRDTGRGIDPADLPRIFNRYERGDTASGTVGAGLGLAIVKRIVELQGGTISVESQVGEGTRFTVRLPLTGPALANERR